MHPILRTVLQRLGLGLVTLFIVSIVIFSAIEMLPGDFAKAILGQAATPETVAAFEKEIGLDQPAVDALLQLDRRRPAGRFRLVLCHRASAIRRTVWRHHRAAPLEHPVPRRHGGGSSPCRWRWPRRPRGALSQQLVRPDGQRRDADDHLVAGVLRRLYPDAVPGGQVPLVFHSLANGQRRHADFLDRLRRARPAGADPDPGHRRAYDAHDAGRRSSTCWPAPISRWRDLKGVPRSKIILAMRCPMPGRRSSTSSPSTLPIWSSAWSSSRWCSSIRASARPWSTRWSRDMPVVQACALIFAVDLHPAQSHRRHHLDHHQSEAAASAMTDSTAPSTRPRAIAARRTAGQNRRGAC